MDADTEELQKVGGQPENYCGTNLRSSESICGFLF
jgi:hypothetical protein